MIKMRMVRFLGMALVIMLIASCSSDQEIRVYSISYPFLTSDQGWTGDFADYPADPVDSVGYHLKAIHDLLPYNINTDSTRKGMRVTGNSLNNELFMFLKRKISGLKPGTTYQILFTVRLASNLPTKQTLGAVATLGEQIYIKVGATPEEPLPVIDENVYRLNLDKGSLQEDGADMITVGTAAVASATKNYTLITRFNNSTHSATATTNDAGELWLIVGADAAASGKTTLYYTQIDVLLNQID